MTRLWPVTLAEAARGAAKFCAVLYSLLLVVAMSLAIVKGSVSSFGTDALFAAIALVATYPFVVASVWIRRIGAIRRRARRSPITNA